MRSIKLKSQSTPIETRIERYKAWHRMQSTSRPLIGILWEADIPPVEEMLKQIGYGNELFPADIEPGP